MLHAKKENDVEQDDGVMVANGQVYHMLSGEGISGQRGQAQKPCDGTSLAHLKTARTPAHLEQSWSREEWREMGSAEARPWGTVRQGIGIFSFLLSRMAHSIENVDRF